MSVRYANPRSGLSLISLIIGGWLVWMLLPARPVLAVPPPCLINNSCTNFAIAYDTPVPTVDGFTINVTAASGFSYQLYACLAGLCNEATPANRVMWIPMTLEGATCGGCDSGARLSGLPSDQRYNSLRILATQGSEIWGEDLPAFTTLPGLPPTTSTTSNPLPDGITINWQTAFNGSSRVTYSLTPPNWYTETLPIPPSDQIQAIDTLPTGVMYAVTTQGNIIRRSASGVWSLQRNVGDRLNAVKALNDNQAWAVGERAAVWRTTDGASWQSVPVPGFTYSWRTVDTAVANTAWVAGENDSLYFYNGSTWLNRTPPGARSSKYIFTIHSINNNEVWAAGTDGLTYHSTNQMYSANWTSVNVPNAVSGGINDNVYTLATYDGSDIYLGGDWGKIWRSTNRGASWQSLNITDGATGVVTLTMPSPTDVWVSQLARLGRYHIGDAQVTYVNVPFSQTIYQTQFISGAQQAILADNQISINKVVGTITEDLTPTTNHTVTLTGLGTTNQPYYYAVESRMSPISAGILGSFQLGPPDTTATTITITDPTGGTLLTNANSYTIRGTAGDNQRLSSISGLNTGDNSTVPVTATPPTPIVGTNVTTTWQATPTFGGGDGVYRYSFTASDGNPANNTSATATVTRDTAPPSLTVTTPNIGGGQVIGLPIQLAGTSSDPNGIDHLDYQLNGAAAIRINPPASGTDTWSTSFSNPLSGMNTIVVHAFDRAGNVTTVSGTFEYLEPTFSLSVSPSGPITADIGQTLSYTLTVTPQNGFNSPVDLTATNPPGLNTTFTPATVNTPYPAVAVSVNTSGGSPGGPYTLTLTGRSGAKTATVNVVITLRTPPNFTISASPNSPLPNLVAGNNGSYSITLSANTTFSGTVALSVSGQPTGVTTQFNPSASVTLNPGQTVSSTLLEVLTIASATPGTHTLTLTGTSGAIVKTVQLTLIIAAPPDFDITFVPSSQTVDGGGPATFYGGTISSLNGFDGVVDLTATVPDPNIQLTSLAPQVTVSPGFPANVILNAKALSPTPGGTYVITVTADSGPTPAHIVTLNLVVNQDATAPVITNIVANPNWNRVLVSWETNEPTTGQLTILSSDGSTNLGSLASAVCTANPCVHSLTFPGLSASTTYRFTITATDQSPARNQTIATTFQDGSLLRFTTLAEPDTILPTVTVDNPAASIIPTTVIGSLPISGTASDNAVVARVEATVRDINNVVRFTGTAQCGLASCNYRIDWVTDATYPNGNYNITVVAIDASGNSSSPVGRTVNLQNDFTAPLLLSGPDVEVAPTCDSGDCWAKITWVTDDLSTSEVVFGLTVSYSSITGDWSYPLGPVYDDKSPNDRSRLYTIHEVTLNNLEPRKIYHYQILSCNQNGKCAS